MGAGQTGALIICSTPRTGSTLLCSLLESTGVAGRPKSYFREEDADRWARQWGIGPIVTGTDRIARFMSAATNAGTTENGVFAARIMWGSMEDVVASLAVIYPGVAPGGPIDLINHAFGRARFVHITRDDVVAQAVSWARAEQTRVWQSTSPQDASAPDREPAYDRAQIQGFVDTIKTHNAAWVEWFSVAGVDPYRIRYEVLDADPMGTISSVLECLDLEMPPNREIVSPNQRMADDLNQNWIDRFRSES